MNFANYLLVPRTPENEQLNHECLDQLLLILMVMDEMNVACAIDSGVSVCGNAVCLVVHWELEVCEFVFKTYL